MTLEKASKTDIIRTFGKLSMKQILTSDYPTVGQLKRYYPVEKVEQVISIIFLDLSASFEGALNQDECAEISIEVSSSILSNLSIEDLYYTCRKIKTSKVFGKLSVNKVLSAINEHFENRCTKAGEMSYNESLAHKFGSAPSERVSVEIDQVEKQKFKNDMGIYLQHKAKPQTQPTENGK